MDLDLSFVTTRYDCCYSKELNKTVQQGRQRNNFVNATNSTFVLSNSKNNFTRTVSPVQLLI